MGPDPLLWRQFLNPCRTNCNGLRLKVLAVPKCSSASAIRTAPTLDGDANQFEPPSDTDRTTVVKRTPEPASTSASESGSSAKRVASSNAWSHFRALNEPVACFPHESVTNGSSAARSSVWLEERSQQVVDIEFLIHRLGQDPRRMPSSTTCLVTFLPTSSARAACGIAGIALSISRTSRTFVLSPRHTSSAT